MPIALPRRPARPLHAARSAVPGLVLLVLSLSSAPAESGGLRVRFREHFDVSRIVWGEPGVTQTYYGSTNTVNLWWEEPGQYAFGLAFNPVLSGGYGEIGGEDPRVDEQVKVLQFGLEGKWHFLHDRWEGERSGPFARGGLYANQLRRVDPEFGGDRWGGAYYLSLGWEIPLFGGGIGVQPDVGFRHSILQQDTQILSFSPSIAVSLYFISDWLEGRGWLGGDP